MVGKKGGWKGEKEKGTGEREGELKFSYQGDEHGRVEFVGGWGEGERGVREGEWGLGKVVEVVVSHVDPTVNLHDRFYVVDEETERCVDVYEIDARGCMA